MDAMDAMTDYIIGLYSPAEFERFVGQWPNKVRDQVAAFITFLLD